MTGVDWINGRVAIMLSEAMERAMLLPAITTRARELMPELPAEWTEDMARELALEITFSEAGLNGDLVFRGICCPGETRTEIPSTYFEPTAVKDYTLHRGFFAECNEITFAPLADVEHDKAFEQAAQQTAQRPDLYPSWQEVEVVASRLAAFLDKLDSASDANRAMWDCAGYLTGERKIHLRQPETKEDYKDRCLKRWPHLSGRGFDKAWGIARDRVPQKGWPRSGPLPRS